MPRLLYIILSLLSLIFVFTLIFLFLILFSDFAFAQDSSKKWRSHIEISGQSGNSRAIGLTDLFLIIKQKSNSIIFTDIRGQIDNKNSNEYNIGLGYRKLFDESIVGTYLYYDRRKSSFDNIFHQLTFGAERLSENWDFRFNTYLPQNKEGDINSHAFIKDNKLHISYSSEKPLKGVDFELGHKIPLGNSRLYLGYYYFAKDNHKSFTYPKKSGTTIRMESKFFKDLIAFGGKLTYDQDSNYNEEIYLRLRIPFGFSKASKLNDLEKRMTDTIIRDIDIVTGNYQQITDQVTLNINNISPDNVYIVDLATVSDIDDVIESYKENSVIILTNSGTLNDEINLKSGQILMSGNSNLSLNYQTARGRFNNIYSPNLANAVINSESDISDYNCSTGIGGSDCLIMIDESNIALKGININGGNDAIYITGDNLLNINLTDLNISNSSDEAIYIHKSNNSNINIAGNIIKNINDDAIYISSSDNNEINIQNSIISNITNDGIDITSGSNNNQFNISNTQFNNITAIPINNKDSSDSNVINIE